MPNYCTNSIHIVGPTAELEAFLARIPRYEDCDDVGYDLLASFVPPADEDYSNCDKLWGTTREVMEVRIASAVRGSTAVAVLEFLSAWAPPVLAFEAIARQFPGLHILMRWYESGIGFCGAAALVGERVAVRDEDMPVLSDEPDCRHLPVEAACYRCAQEELEDDLLQWSLKLMEGLLELEHTD